MQKLQKGNFKLLTCLLPIIFTGLSINATTALAIPVSLVQSKSANVLTIPSAATTDFKPKIVIDKQIANYFHHLLPTTTITSIYTTPYLDTYALIIGTNIVYGNLHSAYLTVGHMFNVYTQTDITTKLQQQTAPKIDISKINIADAIIAKSPNKVHKKLIVFIDPDCPYCRQLEQQIDKQQLNKKADIYYILLPLAMHPHAKEHTTNILCSTEALATLNEYMVKNNDNPKLNLIKDCNIEPVLERTGSIARGLSINATPIIITGDGEMIMGTDINAINEYLSK